MDCQQHPRCVSPDSQMDDPWKRIRISSSTWALDCHGRRAFSLNSNVDGEWKPVSSSDEDSYILDEEKPSTDSSSFTMDFEMHEPVNQFREEHFDKTFVLVLLKYLELKDLMLRQRVLDTIKDCGERKEEDPGYATDDSMEKRLKELVGESCWKETKNLRHLMQKQTESGTKVGLHPNHIYRCLTPTRVKR